MFPNSQRMNRGGQVLYKSIPCCVYFVNNIRSTSDKIWMTDKASKLYGSVLLADPFFFSRQVISEIVESCRSHEITDLILVHEHRGQPDGLIVCHLPLGPTAYFGLLNVVSVHVCLAYDNLRRYKTWNPYLVLICGSVSGR